MNINEKINDLIGKDNDKAYKSLLELETDTTESTELYEYFDDLLKMLESDHSFIRVRGFRLICCLAKWDKDNKINKNIDKILNELDDDKGTSVRPCLDKLKLIIMYKVELIDIIEKKLKNIDLSKHKENMQPLIEKDIKTILETI